MYLNCEYDRGNIILFPKVELDTSAVAQRCEKKKTGYLMKIFRNIPECGRFVTFLRYAYLYMHNKTDLSWSVSKVHYLVRTHARITKSCAQLS